MSVSLENVLKWGNLILSLSAVVLGIVILSKMDKCTDKCPSLCPPCGGPVPNVLVPAPTVGRASGDTGPVTGQAMGPDASCPIFNYKHFTGKYTCATGHATADGGCEPGYRIPVYENSTSDCVLTAGYNPDNCKCCSQDRNFADGGNHPLSYFMGPSGPFCLGKGDPTCDTMCKFEVCQKDDNTIDNACVERCKQNC